MILGQLTMGAHQTKMHPCLWAAPDVLQNFSFKSFICGGGENWVTKVHLYICMPGVCFVFSLKWGFAVKYPGQLPGASNEQLEHTGWKKIIRDEDKKKGQRLTTNNRGKSTWRQTTKRSFKRLHSGKYALLLQWREGVYPILARRKLKVDNYRRSIEIMGY